MHRARSLIARTLLSGFVAVLAACATESTSPPAQASLASELDASNATINAGSIRVRCERRTNPNRSKISVDGNNLAAGTYTARVRAIGGTVNAPPQQAVSGQVEFDFDSNPNDIANGATPIASTFIVSRTGPDVLGVILNAAGQVVTRQAVECDFR